MVALKTGGQFVCSVDIQIKQTVMPRKLRGPPRGVRTVNGVMKIKAFDSIFNPCDECVGQGIR